MALTYAFSVYMLKQLTYYPLAYLGREILFLTFENKFISSRRRVIFSHMLFFIYFIELNCKELYSNNLQVAFDRNLGGTV